MTPARLLSYPPPPVDRREVLRYARATERDGAAVRLLDGVLAEAMPELSYRVAYAVLPAAAEGEVCRVGELCFSSQSLAGRLTGCRRALLFAATVGVALDRRIVRYGRLSPSRALLLQALGAERVEALCDAFLAERSATEGWRLTERFSPGYGDLPLALQREVVRLLDCERLLGVTVGEGLLLSPSKTVTAFCGIRDECSF